MERREFVLTSVLTSVGLAGCTNSSETTTRHRTSETKTRTRTDTQTQTSTTTSTETTTSTRDLNTELPQRTETDATAAPDADLDFTLRPETRQLEITHEGGAEITADNTGWLAVYTELPDSPVTEDYDGPHLKRAWHIAGGDEGFATTPDDTVTVPDIDVDERVVLTWSAPGDPLHDWQTVELWENDYVSNDFTIDYDPESNVLTLTYPDGTDAEPVEGYDGVSLTYVITNELSTETEFAGDDGAAFSFPIEPGETGTVEEPDIHPYTNDSVRLYWVGPNNLHVPIGFKGY